MKHISAVVFVLLLSASRLAAGECVELRNEYGGRLWVYLPVAYKPEASWPCVIVPPAGSRLFHGIRMSDGDRAEHWPYVEQGFVVLSFDISGELDDPSDQDACRTAVQKFINSDCGVSDARKALEVAVRRFPGIDRGRVYVAGHSSAGTLALQIASSDFGIKACVAMAPIGDLTERLSGPTRRWLDRLVPGSSSKLVARSPVGEASKIRCPVFLFHALDDDNVRPDTVVRLKKALESQSVSVEYVKAKTGGHYDSMIQQGLPSAVSWLIGVEQKAKGPSKAGAPTSELRRGATHL